MNNIDYFYTTCCRVGCFSGQVCSIRAGAYTVFMYARPLALLTRPVVGFVAGVCDLGSELQIVSGLVVRRAVSPQCKHATGEAGQVAHLPLQVAILPFANERQTTVGFANEVAFDGLKGKKWES